MRKTHEFSLELRMGQENTALLFFFNTGAVPLKYWGPETVQPQL